MLRNREDLALNGAAKARNVSVSTSVLILDDVQNGAESVFAAGAIGNKSTLPCLINGGVPALQIASRKPYLAAIQ